ncbi:putative transcription factor NAM family [Rosa chinensis]|uniref:Putative transcription factor NAM family n=1 Tax=Rosa chinensis TaxID=74649 RepID=A0A2P6QEP2_ROSCH|nr:NAC domain-containing protein 101 [Rosa chinensis]PRQ32654.1 putative transcription factor NAM family [Rosa chinensis]
MAIRSSGLPVGVRFHPTDHELLDYYLRTRIAMGDHFHSDFVADCPHFYGDNEPWVVWQIYGGGESKKVEDEKTLYFFTHRRRLSPTTKRFDRKVGSGTWSGQNSREVEDDGVVIGLKREFRYEGGCDSRHNDAWLMQEFQLINDDSDFVLCTLRKNPRKAPPTPTAQGSNVVENTRVNDKKRKSIVDQPRKPKSKKQKKEESCHQEQEGSSIVDQMKVGEAN